MPLAPAVTDLEQLKDRPLVAALLAWNAGAVEGAKFDRDELSIYVARESIRTACVHLKSQGLTDFLSDVTCADSGPGSGWTVWAGRTASTRSILAVLGPRPLV